MKSFKIVAVSALLSCMVSGVFASDAPVNSVVQKKDSVAKTVLDVKGSIKKSFESRFPQAHVSAVLDTPFPGIYELIIGKDVAFTNKDGKNVIFGHMIDVVNKKDLSLDHVRQYNKVNVGSLDLNNAIKTVKGDGSRVVYVFSDPDCPFCKILEENMTNITNVTVYTFLFPIDQLHPKATEHASQIWCSKDPSAAWKEYMSTRKMLETNDGKCANPIEANKHLGEKLGITGTPTLIGVNGEVVEGALPIIDLETFLNGSVGKK
jgi:thiol:disulfide interchange protein DsbC